MFQLLLLNGFHCMVLRTIGSVVLQSFQKPPNIFWQRGRIDSKTAATPCFRPRWVYKNWFHPFWADLYSERHLANDDFQRISIILKITFQKALHQGTAELISRNTIIATVWDKIAVQEIIFWQFTDKKNWILITGFGFEQTKHVNCCIYRQTFIN